MSILLGAIGGPFVAAGIVIQIRILRPALEFKASSGDFLQCLWLEDLILLPLRCDRT